MIRLAIQRLNKGCLGGCRRYIFRGWIELDVTEVRYQEQKMKGNGGAKGDRAVKDLWEDLLESWAMWLRKWKLSLPQAVECKLLRVWAHNVTNYGKSEWKIHLSLPHFPHFLNVQIIPLPHKAVIWKKLDHLDQSFSTDALWKFGAV